MHNLLYERVKAERVDLKEEYGLARRQLKNIQLFTRIKCRNYYGEEELDSTKTKLNIYSTYAYCGYANRATGICRSSCPNLHSSPRIRLAPPPHSAL
ncbi:hypothetical protein BDZ91DRAFT_156325 [Kalaharituber pfeilii]|nr:hypothetical protein BDZ91DRAFT_156325 [Kalaharituber pfeilii]